ncbi:MAG TPA: hypothetical protein VEH77_15790 [Roseiarcus sp.]|nr:hypothetical protein [Roseiarcus sp.]
MTALVAASPALAGGWWGPRYGWGRGPGIWAPVAAIAALSGLAVGLAASQAPYPAPNPYWGPRCRPIEQPVLDPYGNVVGYRPSRVCE